MTIAEVLDPFRELTAEVAERVFHAKRRERVVEQRVKALLESYRQLVQDARYTLIAEELSLTLGVQLSQLVSAAKQCRCPAACAPLAERVTLLHEVVSKPLNELWAETHRPQVPVES